ncbi:MAG: three-Cys-motif partner protein TcmP [Burkholderiales bacterium]
MTVHRFGGDWTSQKLQILGEYLTQYRLIFTKAPRARHFHTVYVDGFAGSGERTDSNLKAEIAALIGQPDELDRVEYKKGSTSIALGLDQPFDEYLFIEKNAGRAEELRAFVAEKYPALAPRCAVRQDDANTFLQEWASKTNWSRTRAVVFLDPYGMAVEWSTIEAIAATQAIDLWILFPVGTGVNRLLTRSGNLPPEWAARLTSIFGTDEWKRRFYTASPQTDFFGEVSGAVKDASFQRIGEYFLERLRTVFAGVAPHAMPLENSKNNPLYWLCFAAGNTKGAPTAVRIANHLLRRPSRPTRKH